jgi:hypothetical protein
MSMGGGGSSGGSQSTTNEVILPDWVQSQVQQNIGQANQLAAQPYQQYGGPTLAGLTPDQLASFQAVQQMQGVAPGQIGQAQGMAANLPGTTQSLLAPYMSSVGGDVSSNMNRMANAASSDVANNTPALSAFGGNQAGTQQGTMASETARNVGQAINQVASQGWGTAMTTALNQAGTMGNLASQEQTTALQGAGALGQVGQAQQTQQQAQYAAALQQWQMAQNYPYQQLAVAQSALAGSPYGATVTSSQPYSTNTAAQALGALGSTIPILASAPQAVTNFNTGWNSLFGPAPATATA